MAYKFNLLKKLDMEQLNLIEPVGYLDFLKLLENSKLVLTDSGGVQEEANILNVPCLTLRDNTERPETIEMGANYLVGVDKNKIVEMVSKILNDKEFERSMKNAMNPFGDGRAGERIVGILIKRDWV